LRGRRVSRVAVLPAGLLPFLSLLFLFWFLWVLRSSPVLWVWGWVMPVLS
jgi:hypothetical protein